jgi:cation diffusion facilitator family transporter
MSETGALLVSMAAALVLGIFGLVSAVLSNSQAILLDGLFNVAFFVTALFTLRVAALLRRPDDARFPFGYLYFEPLINTVKGLLILGVALFALIDALITLFSGGRQLDLGPALIYAAAATIICGLVMLTLKRTGGGSPLVEADIGNWSVNAAISAGVFAALVLAALLQRLGMATAAAHVDPVLVGLVVLVSLGVPIRMAGRGLNALLNRAPDAEVVAAIEDRVRGALGDLPLRRLYVRVVRPGRTTYITAHVLLDPSQTRLDVGRADTLRAAIIDALAEAHAPVIVDVVFTAREAFAAPTTGFVRQTPVASAET